MKRIYIRAFTNCRMSGGLYLGLKFNFPMDTLFENGEVRSVAKASVGLVFWTIQCDFRSKDKKVFLESQNQQL